jgi:hypothetical protein
MFNQPQENPGPNYNANETITFMDMFALGIIAFIIHVSMYKELLQFPENTLYYSKI